MADSTTRQWGPWLALAAAILLTGALAQPPQRQTASGPHQPPLLPRPEFLEIAGASILPLVTDYFWVQTLQATTRAQSPEEYRDVYDYAKLVIALDPDFHPIYGFAGLVLPVQDHKGVWYNVAESTELLRQGWARFPKTYSFGIYLAYNLSTYEHDYQGAARVLEQAARVPGAPSYLGPLATRLYAQTGDFDAGSALAEKLYEEATDPDTKQVLEHRLKQLELGRILRQVNAAVEQFQRRTQQRPANLQALVDAKLLPGLPADPMGGEIVLGPDGQARSTVEDDQLRIFQ